MKENGFERGINPESMSRHIQRFVENTQENAEDVVQQILHDDLNISKAEMFRRVSSGRGTGKSHASQYKQPQYDGKLKRS